MSPMAIGTDVAGVVVAVGEDYDLIYSSEVWCILQRAYAQYALVTYSLTTLKPFSLSLERLARSPSLERPACSVSGSGRSFDLEPLGEVENSTGCQDFFTDQKNNPG